MREEREGNKRENDKGNKKEKGLKNLKTNVSLKKYSFFRTGGKADYFFEPASIQELKAGLLHFFSLSFPVFVLGKGSNLLISDQGFRGVVIHLKHSCFSRIQMKGSEIHCGSFVENQDLAAFAQKKGWSGMEFLCGFPGTVGGSVYGNAGGSKSSELKCCLHHVKAFSFEGEEKNYSKRELEFKYREVVTLKNHVLVESVFQGKEEDPKVISRRMETLVKTRRLKDPRGPSCGSVFKNPLPKKAWEIVDRLGFRGRKRGGASVSEKHSNWIVNLGKASSTDIWELILMIQKEAELRLKMKLKLELKLLGEFTRA